MFQVAQSSAGTVVIGVPLDGNGKTLYDNDDSLFYYNSSWRSCPANQLLLLTLANGTTQYADNAGTCSVDECGNVTWNYTANDTATLGNASVSVYYAPGAYPATYSMQPQVMQVGPLLSDSTPWLQLARVHISGVATPSDMNFQDFLLATNPPALAVIQAAFTELNIGPDDPLKPQCWLSANGEYAIVWDGLNGYVTNLAGTVVYFVGTGPEGSVLGPYDAQSGTGTEVSVTATGTAADLSATAVATAASPILSLLTLQFAIQYGLPYQFVANTAYGVMQPAGPYRTGSATYNGWAAVWQTVGESKYLYWDYEDTGNWYLGPDTVPAHATYYNGNNDPTGGTWLEVATNQPGEYPIVLTAMTLPSDGSIKADAAAAITAANIPAGVASMLIAAGLGVHPPSDKWPAAMDGRGLGPGSGRWSHRQQTRDAMKLAPSAGVPAAGSIDADLAVIEQATGANPSGVVKTIQTNDVNGNPVAGVMVYTSSDVTGQTCVGGPAISNAGGLATLILLPGVQYVQMCPLGLRSPAPTNYGLAMADFTFNLLAAFVQPTVGTYATRSDVENIFGIPNVATWALLSTNDPNSTAGLAEVAARIALEIQVQTAEIDDHLREGGFTLPLVVNESTISVVRLCATLVGVALYENRGTIDYNHETGRVEHRYQFKKDWANKRLDEIRSGKFAGMRSDRRERQPGQWRSRRRGDGTGSSRTAWGTMAFRAGTTTKAANVNEPGTKESATIAIGTACDGGWGGGAPSRDPAWQYSGPEPRRPFDRKGNTAEMGHSACGLQKAAATSLGDLREEKRGNAGTLASGRVDLEDARAERRREDGNQPQPTSRRGQWRCEG